jgi:hypothetical protein
VQGVERLNFIVVATLYDMTLLASAGLEERFFLFDRSNLNTTQGPPGGKYLT